MVPTPYRTTSDLNFRAAPTTAGRKISVLPKHYLVHAADPPEDGWLNVTPAAPAGVSPPGGWCSLFYLERLPDREPLWMQWMRAKVGEHEVPGKGHNPWVLEAHATTSLHARDDETAWCSAAVNWCMVRAGIPGTNSAAARSWLRWGEHLPMPRPGAVTVLWRGAPSSDSGHVALFIREEGSRVLLLGGNQNNQVGEQWYPRSRVITYRWPQGVPR